MGEMDTVYQHPPPYHKGNSSDARRSLSDIQETLSQIYVAGVCAMAGYSIGQTMPDVDKTDMTVAGTVSGTQASVRLQLKSTYQNGRIGDDSFAYRIKDDELRELLAKARGHPSPFVLVVLHLPRRHGEWLTNNADRLSMQHCAYWILCDDIDYDSLTVHIPRANLFDVRSIRKLMDTSAERVRETQARWEADR